jgi:uncharacterized protein (DUF1778 family)
MSSASLNTRYMILDLREMKDALGEDLTHRTENFVADCLEDSVRQAKRLGLNWLAAELENDRNLYGAREIVLADLLVALDVYLAKLMTVAAADLTDRHVFTATQERIEEFRRLLDEGLASTERFDRLFARPSAFSTSEATT